MNNTTCSNLSQVPPPLTEPVQIPELLVDPEAVEAAVRLIVADGDVTELRALDAMCTGDRYPGTLSGYFNDPHKLAEAAATIESAKGIYFTPNPVDPRLLARAENRLRRMGKGDSSTTDGDIVRRRWLLVDADPKRPSGISATEAEHAAAIEKVRRIADTLAGQGWPRPILADSGNGAHALFSIDLPRDDGGLVQRCLEALAAEFDDDAVTIDTKVFNPARIWKLYGSRACKGDSTADRPHRMARILEVPDEIGIS